MLAVGLINLADASYGGEFLRMMSSIYPGADSARTIGKVLLGAVYGLVDGGVCGFVFAVVYRFFVNEERKTVGHGS